MDVILGTVLVKADDHTSDTVEFTNVSKSVGIKAMGALLADGMDFKSANYPTSITFEVNRADKENVANLIKTLGQKIEFTEKAMTCSDGWLLNKLNVTIPLGRYKTSVESGTIKKTLGELEVKSFQDLKNFFNQSFASRYDIMDGNVVKQCFTPKIACAEKNKTKYIRSINSDIGEEWVFAGYKFWKLGENQSCFLLESKLTGHFQVTKKQWADVVSILGFNVTKRKRMREEREKKQLDNIKINIMEDTATPEQIEQLRDHVEENQPEGLNVEPGDEVSDDKDVTAPNLVSKPNISKSYTNVKSDLTTVQLTTKLDWWG